MTWCKIVNGELVAVKVKNYVVVFDGQEGLDTIRVAIKQGLDRPNNADDIEVIKEYVLNEYGYKDYEIIELDLMEEVIL